MDRCRTAILNLVADATHNFTDGLAIGVAFGRGEHELATTLGTTDFIDLVQTRVVTHLRLFLACHAAPCVSLRAH